MRGGCLESRRDLVAKELRHHKLTDLRLKSDLRHDNPGRPAGDASPRKVYSLQASLQRDEAALAKARQRSGRFILATNDVVTADMPEEERYTNDELP